MNECDNISHPTMCHRVFEFISTLQKVGIQKVNWMIRNTMSKVCDYTMERL